MKRTLCLLLSLLLLALSGCSFRDAPAETVSFYYLRSEVTYGTADGVIAPEDQDVTGQPQDLASLLSLYFQGPTDETLTSPFPSGTHLLGFSEKNYTLHLSLSNEFTQLEELDLTLACACISSTCFGITDAQQVRITTPGTTLTEGIDLTISRDGLILFDELPEETAAESESE